MLWELQRRLKFRACAPPSTCTLQLARGAQSWPRARQDPEAFVTGGASVHSCQPHAICMERGLVSHPARPLCLAKPGNRSSHHVGKGADRGTAQPAWNRRQVGQNESESHRSPSRAQAPPALNSVFQGIQCLPLVASPLITVPNPVNTSSRRQRRGPELRRGFWSAFVGQWKLRVCSLTLQALSPPPSKLVPPGTRCSGPCAPQEVAL